METTVYEIKLNDGAVYRVNCTNASQKRRVMQTIQNIFPLIKSWNELTNGIHTVNQWERIAKTLETN